MAFLEAGLRHEACTTKVERQNGALLGEGCVVEFLAVSVLYGEMHFKRQMPNRSAPRREPHSRVPRWSRKITTTLMLIGM